MQKIDFKNVLAGIGIGAIFIFLVFLAANRDGSITASLVGIDNDSSEVIVYDADSSIYNNSEPENDLVWSLIRVMKQEIPTKNSQNRFSFKYSYYDSALLDPTKPPYQSPFTLKDIEFNEDYKSTTGYDKLDKEGKIYSIPLISGDGKTYVIEEVENAPPSLSNYDITYSCFVLGKGGIERNHFSGKGTKIALTPEKILGFKLINIPNDPIGEVLVCTFKNTKKIPKAQSKTLGE